MQPDHEDGCSNALNPSSGWDEGRETRAGEADGDDPKEVASSASGTHDDETSGENHGDRITKGSSRSSDIRTPLCTENLSSRLKRNSDSDDTSVQRPFKLSRTTEFHEEALIATAAEAERFNKEALSTAFTRRSKIKTPEEYTAFRLLQYACDIASDLILGDIREFIAHRCTQIKVSDNLDWAAFKNLHKNLKEAEAKVHVEIARTRWMKVQYYVTYSHHVKKVQQVLDDSRQEKKSKGFHINCQWPQEYQDLGVFHTSGRKAPGIIKRWAKLLDCLRKHTTDMFKKVESCGRRLVIHLIYYFSIRLSREAKV